MGLIYSGSSDAQSYHHSSALFEPLVHWLLPSMSALQIQSLHYVVRKCAHLTEYALLAGLLWRAIHQPVGIPRRWGGWCDVALVLGLVGLYSATDEFHQTFISGRTGQVSDVLVDLVGGTLGLGIGWLAQLIRTRPGGAAASQEAV